MTRTQALMGTFVHITIEKDHNKQISQSFNLIREIEHSLSSYDKEALVYKLNHSHKVPYDTYLAQAIRDSKHYYTDTQGYFDITIGSISKNLYHFGEEKMYAPSKEVLQRAKLSIDGIHLDKKFITTDKDIVVDLGGMGKGYAVDKVIDYLNQENINTGIIALSGDIQCLDPCEIYLQSPFGEDTFAQIRAKEPHLSISTSGTYRRYATKKKDHHLINPKTATQGREFVSVSLFTQANNAKIDAYATAVSVMPKEKAIAFLKAHKEIGYVLVEPNGHIEFGNLEKFLEITWENPLNGG